MSTVITLKVEKSTVRKVILALMTLLILSFRPSLPGQVLNEGLLLAPLLGLAFLYILFELPVYKRSSRIVLLLMCLGFSGYLVVHTTLLSPAALQEMIQVIIVLVASALISAFFFHPQDTLLVLKIIAVIFLWLSASQVITYSVTFLTGNPNLLLLGTLVAPTTAQPWPVYWHFPFTFTAGGEWFMGALYPRATGIFREPGIYQMFLILTYFLLDYLHFRYKQILRLVLLFGLFTVFSTAGYVIFLACLLYTQLPRLKRKRTFFIAISMLFVISLAAIYIWDNDTLGVRYKIYVQGERIDEVSIGLAALAQSPWFGLGVVEQTGGINFIASLSRIGLVGGVLYMTLVTYAVMKHTTRKTIIIYLPLLITMLFAQPLYTKGFTIFFWFLSVKSLQVVPHLSTARRKQLQYLAAQEEGKATAST